MSQTANIGSSKQKHLNISVDSLSVPSALNWYPPVFWDHNSRIPAMSRRHWIRPKIQSIDFNAWKICIIYAYPIEMNSV